MALLDHGDEILLDTINANHPGDYEKCAAEMLKLWLSKKPKASWGQLLKVLRDPNIALNSLAENIKKMLSKSTCSYVCIYNINFYTYLVHVKLIYGLRQLLLRCKALKV